VGDNIRVDMNLEEQISKYVRRDVIYVEPDSTLGEVASIMAKNNADVVIVRRNDGEVIGLVTAQEIFDALRTYVLGKDLLENIPGDIRDISVNELVRRNKALDFMDVCSLTGTNICISIGENETIANAVRVMSVAGVSHLLIVGLEGIVGTLCAEDLLKAFVQ